MAVNATDFQRELKRVCDVFKIPALYSEQETAPTKTGEVTGRFLTLQGVEVLLSIRCYLLRYPQMSKMHSNRPAQHAL